MVFLVVLISWFSLVRSMHCFFCVICDRIPVFAIRFPTRHLVHLITPRLPEGLITVVTCDCV